MCFSAAASFTAGGLLSTVGITILAKNNNKRTLFLVSMPLLFGIQQLIEGFLWITPFSSNWHQILTYSFLAFALVIWPLYIPMAILLIEKNPLRKKIISYLAILGILISSYLLALMIINPISSEIVNHSINYILHEPYPILGTIIYVIATCGSPLVSSHKFIRILGIFSTIGLLTSLYFYRVTFQSVWCFFAAIISLAIYFYIKRHSFFPPFSQVP